MKFRRGASQESINRRSREQAARDLAANATKDEREKLKKLRAAAALAKKELRAECGHKRGNARLQAHEGRIEVRNTLAQDLAHIDAECARRVEERIVPLQRSIEQLAADLKSSAVMARGNRERERGRPKLSAKENREAEFDRVRHAIQARDARLLPIFERVKRGLKPAPRQTLEEAFWEYVEENPEALENEQARQEAAITDLDVHCAEAIHEGKLGNEEARAWAREHCTSRKRPRGSAKSRTIGLFGPSLVPRDDDDEPLAKKGYPVPLAPPLPRKGRARGQQSLSAGPLGGSVLDTPPF